MVIWGVQHMFTVFFFFGLVKLHDRAAVLEKCKEYKKQVKKQPARSQKSTPPLYKWPSPFYYDLKQN